MAKVSWNRGNFVHIRYDKGHRTTKKIECTNIIWRGAAAFQFILFVLLFLLLQLPLLSHWCTKAPQLKQQRYKITPKRLQNGARKRVGTLNIKQKDTLNRPQEQKWIRVTIIAIMKYWSKTNRTTNENNMY